VHIDHQTPRKVFVVIRREACLPGIGAKYAGIWYLWAAEGRKVAGCGPECGICEEFEHVPQAWKGGLRVDKE